MNMLIRKSLSLLLLGAMLTGTACGSSGTTVTDETTDGASTDTTTAAPVVSEYKKPDVDYNGAEFPIVALTLESGLRIASYNMLIDEANGDVINDAIVKVNQTVEEELNVDLQLCSIKYDTRQTTSQFANSILAGDDEFKFAMIFTCGMPTLLGQPDMLVDLATINTLDLSKSWWNQNSVEEFKLFGKQYAVAGDICFNLKGSPICNFFNKQLIDELKLEDPYKLVNEGKWTIDKMIKMSADAYSDLNGNTKVDVDDRYGMACEGSTLTYMLYGAGQRFSDRVDGEIKLTINTPDTVSVIEKLVPALNDDGPAMFNVTYQSSYNSVFNDLFTPTFIDNRLLFYANQLLVALDLRNMNADFGILPSPKLDEDQEGYHTASNTWWSDNVIVPVTNPDLEMTGHVLDAMGYYSQQYVTTAFIDETVIGKAIRDEESAKNVQLLFDTQLFDVCQIFNWGKLIDGVNNLAYNNNTAFSSMYASTESAAKEALAKTIEQLGG